MAMDRDFVVEAVEWDRASGGVVLRLGGLTPMNASKLNQLAAALGNAVVVEFPEDYLLKIRDGQPTEFTIKVNP